MTLVLMAAACSGTSGADDASTPDHGSSTATASESPAQNAGGSDGGSTATGNAPVAEVLRFSAPRLDGGTIEGEDYSGRDVAFWFWAPW